MKSVKAKVHNKEFVELKYDAVSDKYVGLIQVPDTPSDNELYGRYGITVDAVDEVGNVQAFDRFDNTWGSVLQIKVNDHPDPSRIQLLRPQPPDYKVTEMYDFLQALVYCRYPNYVEIQILFDGQSIEELGGYYERTVESGRVRLSNFSFDPYVYEPNEGVHQITIITGSISSVAEIGGLTILSFPLLYDTDTCTFIFDRTQADVDYVKQLKEKYLNGTATDSEKNIFVWDNLKGARNRSDFVRILSNMIYLADKFNIPFSMTVEGLPEIPNITYVQQLRDEIERFRTSLPVHFDTPKTPILPINTYQKMNDLEKILFDIHDTLKYQEQIYIGDSFYMDETIGIL